MTRASTPDPQPAGADSAPTARRVHRRLPLRKALPLLMAALLLSSVTIIAAVTTSALSNSLYGQLNSEVRLAAERSLSTSVATGDSQIDPSDPVPPGLTQRTQRARTISVDVRNGVLRAGYIDDSGTPTYHQLTQAQVSALLAVPVDDSRIYEVEVPGLGTYRAIAQTDSTGARIVTAVSQATVSQTIASYVFVEFLVMGIAVVSAIGIGWVLLRRALRPLEVVAATAQAVSATELSSTGVQLSARIPEEYVDSTSEVGRVAGSFNQMLTHIDEAFQIRNRSERKLRRFVADASHELRTPLASIRGYTELVLRDREHLPEHATEQLGRVKSESERMSGLVEDLLLLARLDSEPVIERRDTDLRGLLIDAIADAHAAGPDHHWQLDLDAATPLELMGDENSLRQILVNLLANARVHTPKGTNIVLGAHRVDDQAVITVRDDGPGVPPELLERIFDRFTKGDGSRTPGAGSTGLGLSIVQALVHAHDGSIRVDSVPGEGTTFTVQLPLLPQQESSDEGDPDTAPVSSIQPKP